jgi:Flp pilus assembly pilin Flp
MPSATCVGMAIRLTAISTHAVKCSWKVRRDMSRLTKMYLKVREFHRKLTKGQTMTEYAMIVALIAVVVFFTYQVMGQNINHLATWAVDNDLVPAS